MNIVNKLLRHELINGSFYIFIGSIFSNILAFIFNLFLVRNLAASDYGIYASLLSIIALFGIPAQAFTPVIVRFATSYFSKQEVNKARFFYFKSFKYIFIVSLCIFWLIVIFSHFLLNFFHLNNVYYIILMAGIIAFSYLSLVNNAFLQSLLKFGFMSFIGGFGSLLKLIVGVILVFMGFRVFGGLFAVMFMSIASILLGFIPLRFLFKKTDKTKVVISKREIFAYAIPTTIAVLGLTSFISMDVILVRHFFNSEQAGLYAGLSLVGRVIFYFTGPIPMVMFPLIIKRHALGKNFNNLFYLAILLVLLPSFSIMVFYFFFPGFVVNLFLGGKNYLQIVPYIGLIGFFITIFNILNVCVNFFLSLKKTNIAWVVAVGAIMQIILISLFHQSFYQIIGISIFTTLLVLIAVVGYFIKNYVNINELKDSLALINNPKT